MSRMVNCLLKEENYRNGRHDFARDPCWRNSGWMISSGKMTSTVSESTSQVRQDLSEWQERHAVLVLMTVPVILKSHKVWNICVFNFASMSWCQGRGRWDNLFDLCHWHGMFASKFLSMDGFACRKYPISAMSCVPVGWERANSGRFTSSWFKIMLHRKYILLFGQLRILFIIFDIA